MLGRAANRRATNGRNPDGNARLTGISASFVLPLVLIEVVTVALGVRSVITLHVAVGLAVLGPVLLKLASVTYRMASYYRGANGYAQRGRPGAGLRLLGGALALSFLLMLASGLALIVGPSGVHSAARSTHVVSAYVVVLLLIGHLAIHVRPAARLASADIRPRTPKVQGARSRWLALLVSLTLGGVLALLLGGRGTTYLHHYYPGYPARRSSSSAQPVVAVTRATDRGLGACGPRSQLMLMSNQTTWPRSALQADGRPTRGNRLRRPSLSYPAARTPSAALRLAMIAPPT